MKDDTQAKVSNNVKMIFFYLHAKKPKGFAFSLVLRISVFGTRD